MISQITSKAESSVVVGPIAYGLLASAYVTMTTSWSAFNAIVQLIDTHNAHNGYAFTVPSGYSGLYKVTFMANTYYMTGSGLVGIGKNGSPPSGMEVVCSAYGEASKPGWAQKTVFMNLVAGDYLVFQHTSTSNNGQLCAAQECTWSIEFVR